MLIHRLPETAEKSIVTNKLNYWLSLSGQWDRSAESCKWLDAGQLRREGSLILRSLCINTTLLFPHHLLLHSIRHTIDNSIIPLEQQILWHLLNLIVIWKESFHADSKGLRFEVFYRFSFCVLSPKRSFTRYSLLILFSEAFNPVVASFIGSGKELRWNSGSDLIARVGECERYFFKPCGSLATVSTMGKF